MQLQIQKDKLAAGLSAVASVVKSRTTLPILSNVLLSAKDGAIELTTTDLDVTSRCSIACQVDAPGATTVPVSKLGNIASRVEGNVEVRFDGKTVTLRSDNVRFELNALDAEEFPALPKLDGLRKMVVPQAALKDAVRKTTWAQSDNMSRPMLNGVLFHFNGLLTLLATNGHVLAKTEIETEGGDAKGEFVLPSKAVAELGKLIGDSGVCVIEWNENQARFTCEDCVLTSKLLDGKFPSVLSAIPTETKERIVFDRSELIAALRCAEIMTSDKNIVVKLTFSKNNLSIEAYATDVGKALVTLPVNYKGADTTIALNPSYLIDALAATGDDEAYIHIIDPLSAVIAKDSGSFMAVIMPMRLS